MYRNAFDGRGSGLDRDPLAKAYAPEPPPSDPAKPRPLSESPRNSTEASDNAANSSSAPTWTQGSQRGRRRRRALGRRDDVGADADHHGQAIAGHRLGLQQDARELLPFRP